MADRPNHLERYAVGPADFDPRVMDPLTEERAWRERSESAQREAYKQMAMSAFNTLSGVAAMAGSSPAGSRVRAIGNMIGWPNLGFGLYSGWNAYDHSNQAREAEDTANRWQRGQVPSLNSMREQAFRPTPPISAEQERLEAPRGPLMETIRNPQTGQVLHVPQGTTWEHDGHTWRLRYPAGSR